MNRPHAACGRGIAEVFTLQRLKLPPSLYKCLATINLIESPQSGVARRTAKVKYGVIREWSSVGLPRPGYSLETVSEKSPAEISQEKVA